MRVPQIFVPEKRLDYKIEELSEERNTKKFFEDPILYEEIYKNLKIHIDLLERYPEVRIFWVSDRNKTNRYENVEEIVNKTIERLGKTLAHEIYDFYDKKFERKDEHTILKAYCRDKPPIQIVYVNHETTEKLRRNAENTFLFDRSFIMLI